MSEQEYRDAVEKLVDQGGIRGMLAALEQVCQEKGKRFMVNWQDVSQAAAWDTVAHKVRLAHTRATALRL